MNRTEAITGQLLRLKNQIEVYAKECGLSFFDVIFEVCSYDTINILAAQGGFPSRYPHWRFGMDYDQLSKGYTYGVQKIYEMVINTNPVYAYLLKANNLVDQKIVMAHVYGHADFFKNNAWFSHTNRKMMDVMANHATKIRRYMDKHGIEEVENFIEQVLSIENLIDVNILFRKTESGHIRYQSDDEDSDFDAGKDGRSAALKSFMKSHSEKEDKTKKKKKLDVKFPIRPVVDIMGFLGQHSPLEEWQLDIIGILRDEAYYFLPQRLTKIMNEGWASYWHSKMMTEKVLGAHEIVDFSDHHSRVMQMSRQQLNPYKIGIEIFRDIEYRWDTGKYGKEYQECSNMRDKSNWDLNKGEGRDKIFEVRKIHNDVTFIDEFLTPEFCERANIFTYKFNPRTGRYEIDTRDFLAIKGKLLSQLSNFGQPKISIEDANYANRGELLLIHEHFGVDLDMAYAADTMKNIFNLWKRPVNLRTHYDDKEVIFVYDGKELRPVT